MERRLKFILASKNTDIDMTKKYQSNGKIKKFAYQLLKNPKWYIRSLPRLFKEGILGAARYPTSL